MTTFVCKGTPHKAQPYYWMKLAAKADSIAKLKDHRLPYLTKLFTLLEQHTWYMPTNNKTFIRKAKALYGHGGKSKAGVQEFVNGQTHVAVEDGMGKDESAEWVVSSQGVYRPATKHTYDMRITCTPRSGPDSRFNIWFESDNSRLDQLCKKVLEKFPLLITSDGFTTNDLYVALVYNTGSMNQGPLFPDVMDAAMRYFQIPISVAILLLTPAKRRPEKKLQIQLCRTATQYEALCCRP